MSKSNASERAFYILVHFFAIPYKTTMSSEQILGFVGNANTRRLILLSQFELKSSPCKFNSWTVQLNLAKNSQ